MFTVKFRKFPELFPNRKVRTVRTEQLWYTPAEFLPAWCSQGWEPFQDREQSSTSSLLPEHRFSIHSITGSYACTAATSAYVGLTVHRARSDVYHRNLTGR